VQPAGAAYIRWQQSCDHMTRRNRKLVQEEYLMRHVISTIAAFTLASAVGAFAQDQQAPAQPPAGDQAPAQSAGNQPKSTLTGCVVQAKTTDGGTAYVLTKVEGGSASMYVLGGSAQPDWSTNVNKKIEVTGPVQEPPSADKDSAANPNVVRPPAIVAESVKVVAESCK
jgi:hypothetical protein